MFVAVCNHFRSLTSVSFKSCWYIPRPRDLGGIETRTFIGSWSRRPMDTAPSTATLGGFGNSVFAAIEALQTLAPSSFTG